MYGLADSISDLLEQPIRGNSVNAMMHCPFHEDRTPSFSIHLDEGVWHCFSCGRSGNIKKLYRELGEEIDPNVRYYQAKRDAEAPIVKTTDFSPLSSSQIRGLDTKRGRARLGDFCARRGISADAIRDFGIGYDTEKDALCFPYVDQDERVVGVKYRYPNGFKASETGSVYGVYGLNHAIGKSTVIICEGESDTLSAYSRYGADFGVCGTSGASVSVEAWNRHSVFFIFAKRVYSAYDADAPGDRCHEALVSVLGDKVVRLRPTRGKDLCDHFANGGNLEELGLEKT